MFTYKTCSHCELKFTHQESESKLNRGNILCNTCKESEEIALFIWETSVSRGWENAEFFAQNRYGDIKTEKAMRFIDKIEQDKNI